MNFEKHFQVAQFRYSVSSAVVWNCSQDTKHTFRVMMAHFPGHFCDVCTLLLIMKFLINVQLIFLLANRLNISHQGINDQTTDTSGFEKSIYNATPSAKILDFKKKN